MREKERTSRREPGRRFVACLLALLFVLLALILLIRHNSVPPNNTQPPYSTPNRP